MNRGIYNRVRKLEHHLQVGVELTLYDDNSPEGWGRCFGNMKGSTKEFFRLVDWMLMDENAIPEGQGENWALAQMKLNSLRRATRIEGRSAQLFSLLRALALGPVEEEPEAA